MLIKQFFLMGGYAVYVWPVYGLAVSIIIINSWWSIRRLKQTRQRIRRWLEREV